MPDTTSQPATDAPAAKGGGAKRYVIVGLLCALILGAGFVLGGRLGGSSATAESPTTTEAPAAAELLGEIVELEPVNINLAGGHYLRIAVSLGLDAEASHSGGDGGHGASDDEPAIATAPAADLVLSTFTGRQMDDLATPDGRESARRDLAEGIEHFYGDAVATVFFREFVMQ